jgi:hypothetical protein
LHWSPAVREALALGSLKRLAREGAAVAFTYAASREKAEQLAHSVEAGEEQRWRSTPIAPMLQPCKARSTKL